MTFYLKYRPQTISGLDLTRVREELSHILSSGKFAHAYLFSGPRGTGKTSSARILAKVVNCEKNRDVIKSGKGKLEEPCNECSACEAITRGGALDIIEIDAASNRGIDDIRELKERITLAPSQFPYKVYIIDEVHMLTVEAFNALLKTLEEPPEHALFFLCTTELAKVPETIVSRCTRVNFERASVEEVVGSLNRVAKAEKLGTEDEVLELIAGSVDGSFRDGMKILEQLSLRVEGKKERTISNTDVMSVLGTQGGKQVDQFLQALLNGKRKEVFQLIDTIHSEGGSYELFLRELMNELRRYLLIDLGVHAGKTLDGMNGKNIRTLIGLFLGAAKQLKTSILPSLPLEIAVSEYFSQDGGVKDSYITNTETTVKKEKESVREVEVSALKVEENTQFGGEQQVSKKKGKSGGGVVAIDEVQKKWAMVLEKLRPKNHSLEALLKAATPKEMIEDTLVIEVRYKFHKEQLELVRYKAMVEEVVREVIADGVQLRYILGENVVVSAKQTDNLENVSGDVGDEDIINAAEEIFS